MTQNLNHYEKILSRSHSNYLAQISIEMTDANNQINDVLSKLTALGTVLIPMNLVTGLWGMNVHVPGQDVEVRFLVVRRETHAHSSIVPAESEVVRVHHRRIGCVWHHSGLVYLQAHGAAVIRFCAFPLVSWDRCTDDILSSDTRTHYLMHTD